jgi:hypothetical protein
MTDNTTPAWIDGHIVAEDAPIGVQLWPTIDPKFAANYTLAQVGIIRDAYGTHVHWLYEGGAERLSKMGEKIAVRTEHPIREGVRMAIVGSDLRHWGTGELTTCGFPGYPAAPADRGAWCTRCGIAAGEIRGKLA